MTIAPLTHLIWHDIGVTLSIVAGAVLACWALRSRPSTESDAAAGEGDLENDNHGGRDNA